MATLRSSSWNTFATSDEVGLAVHLHEHTDAGTGVDVAADGALSGRAASFLFGTGNALLAQPLAGLGHVPAGFGQGLLAVHHPCAGLVAQFLDKLR